MVSWMKALMPSDTDQCTLDEQQGQQVWMTFLLLIFTVIKCCNKGYHIVLTIFTFKFLLLLVTRPAVIEMPVCW